jgi:aldehyde:ferredoxin oxidoreductase
MTNGGTSTQANGFFGACLKYSGYDAVVIQGQSAGWVYLRIQDGAAELCDAAALVGKDTWDTQDALQVELGLSGHQLSVYSIGRRENLVRRHRRDYGHVAARTAAAPS